MQTKSTTSTSSVDLDKLENVILRRLMPFIMLCYLFAFLDRTNISIAKEQLQIDLGLSAAAYGLGAGLFFVAYAGFEIPSNLILSRVGARLWIFRIMITWGIVSVCMVFVTGQTSFYIMRMLLGVAEAGFFPGIVYYLSFWLRAKSRARANGFLLITVALSSIIGNPVGGAILQLHGFGGLHGWQWLFLLEGVPTILLSFCVLKFLPDRPSHAKWIPTNDAAYLESEIEREGKVATEASGYTRLARS